MIGLAITNNIWALLGLWALTGLAIAGLFVLGHDASHNALLDSRRMNRIIAQICMGPSVHVESAWDLGHNRIHHGYTSRQGFDFVWHPLTTEDFNKLSTFAKMRHRLEWSAFGSGAYFLREVWWQKMWRFNAPGIRSSTCSSWRDDRNMVERTVDAHKDARHPVSCIHANLWLDCVRSPRRPRNSLVGTS
jgi:hypothetical protein